VRHNTRGISSNIIRILFTAGLVVCFLIIAAAAGLFVFDRVYKLTLASDILPDFTIEHKEESTGEVSYEPGEPLPRWEGTERVNVLVMGIDQPNTSRAPGAQTPCLS